MTNGFNLVQIRHLRNGSLSTDFLEITATSTFCNRVNDNSWNYYSGKANDQLMYRYTLYTIHWAWFQHSEVNLPSLVYCLATSSTLAKYKVRLKSSLPGVPISQNIGQDMQIILCFIIVSEMNEENCFTWVNLYWGVKRQRPFLPLILTVRQFIE